MKKFVNAVIFMLMVVMLGMPVYATTDTKAPECSDFSIDKNGKTLKVGDSVKIKVKIEDESKIEQATAFLISDAKGGGPGCQLKYNSSSGYYEGEYTFTEIDQTGKYSKFIVDAYDTVRNSGHKEFTGSYLFLEGGTADTKAPECSDFSIDKNGKTLKVGDSVKIKVKIEDESKIEQATAFLISDATGGGPGCQLKYNSSSGYYEGEYTFTEIDQEGKYSKFIVDAYDTVRNSGHKEFTGPYLYLNQIPTWTVSFNTNAHGNAPADQKVSDGSKATKPADLTETGFVFGGWSLNGTEVYDFNTPVTKNITLNAIWKPANTNTNTNSGYPSGNLLPSNTNGFTNTGNATLTPVGTVSNATPSAAPTAPLTPITSLETVVGTLSEYAEPSGAVFHILKAQELEAKKNSITIGWNAVPGAVGYVVYGSQAGVPYKKLADINASSFRQDGLAKGVSYKYFIAPYDAAGNILTISKPIHVSAGNNNPNSVKLSKKKINLNVGDSASIRASIKGGKGQNSQKVAYESSNPAVATVSANGVINAVASGKCTIFVYAQNGVFTKCKVTVK